jgi:biotin carboxyl carrier protein
MAFLKSILRDQCRLDKTYAGAILQNHDERRVRILAVYPNVNKGNTPPAWLKRASFRAHEDLPCGGIIVPLSEQHKSSSQSNTRSLMLYPVGDSFLNGSVLVLLIASANGSVLKARRDCLQETIRSFNQLSGQQFLLKCKHDLGRLRAAIETVSALNEQGRFTSAAMAFCNEISSRWDCDRVSLGFPKGRYVRICALSHAEHFNRKMQIVHDIEASMEECLDQDCEVSCPAAPTSTYVYRAAEILAQRHGPMASLSVPLRHEGEPCAVALMERSADKPFGPDEVEAIRLTCHLCTPRLLILRDKDRWIGAKTALGARKTLSILVGPTHTFLKLLAILLLGGLLFIILARGPYRAKAPFVLEATHRQLVCAPFDGFLESAEIEVGDIVQEGKTQLAQLDTTEQVLQLVKAQAERETYSKQAATAMRDEQVADAQIAKANIAKIEAQIKLLEYQISKGKITAPLSGTIINGDLRRQIGAPVKTGDVLFELTPLESLRAELLVPEDRIPEIVADQHGYLATASYPAQRIGFVVEQINPIAEVVNQRNVFRVRCRLLETKPWMRPGMEGVAKVDIGERPYVWIWTRRLINWIRMKLWI